MEYQIVKVSYKEWRYGIPKMEEKVAKAIAEGWKPLGGISVSECLGRKSHEKWATVSQAMVKE